MRAACGCFARALACACARAFEFFLLQSGTGSSSGVSASLFTARKDKGGNASNFLMREIFVTLNELFKPWGEAVYGSPSPDPSRA